MAEPVEIGYLCRKGHFIFHDEPGLDNACGSKRMAGIFVVPEEGVYPHYFAEAVQDAREDFGEALGHMYPKEPEPDFEVGDRVEEVTEEGTDEVPVGTVIELEDHRGATLFAVKLENTKHAGRRILYWPDEIRKI